MSKAISSFVAQYQQQLLRYIKTRIHNVDDAEDILAHVFEKLMSQERHPDNPIAWLYRVTKNSIVDYYRVQQPMGQLPDDLEDKTTELDQFKQLAVCVLPMLNAMDKKHEQVIRLVDIEGLKLLQAADDLKLTLPALKSRLLRARSELKKQMVRCCPPILNQKGSVVDFSSPAKQCNKC